MYYYNLFATIFVFALFYCCRSQEECLNVDEDGSCLQRCPEGTFAYNPSCENITMSQLTCRQPEARSMGYFCDFIRCDCLEQKYWDEAAMKCVTLEECSDQSKVVDETTYSYDSDEYYLNM